MERASVQAIDRPRRGGAFWSVSVCLAALFAAVALPGCGPSAAEAEFEIDPGYQPPPEGEVRVAGESLPVRLLYTAQDRRFGAERTAFVTSDGSPRGLLYVLPPESVVRYDPSIVDFATSIAFLNESGDVLDIVEVPATPRDSDQFALEARATGSFPVVTDADVRYLLQVPSGYFRGLQVGDAVELPIEQLEELVQEGVIEPDRPVATLIYERRPEFSRDGRLSIESLATVHFSLHVAETQEARNELLSPQGISSLQANEAGFVMWPEPRRIAVSARHGFEQSFFLVPFEVTGNEFRPLQLGPLVELRPLEQRRRFELFSPTWGAVQARRNWEYRSAEEYHGYFVFSYAALDALDASRQRNAFATPRITLGESIELQVPAELLRRVAEPHPRVVEVALEVAGEAHRLPMRVVDTHDGRVRGLQLESSLPSAAEWAQRQEADAEEAEPFDADLDEVDPVPAAYWLRFDEERPRPTLTGGLPTPFDVIYFDASGLAVAVRRNVTDASTVYPQSSSFLSVGGRLESYQSLVLAPAGFVDETGMIREREDGSRTLNRVRLQAPNSVSIEWPEPERYPIIVDGREIEVEVAYREFDRLRGVMWRRDLPQDGGMIFLFTDRRVRQFFMLNCFVDLTTAYIAESDDAQADGTIARIVNMYHPQLPFGERSRIQADPEDMEMRRAVNEQELRDQSDQYGSGEEVRFVLEMPYNWFSRQGIGEQATIELGEVIRHYLELAEATPN